MEVKKTKINGLFILQPRIFQDERGTFFESFNLNKFQEIVGSKVDFVQDNESVSKKGVLRGLHFQNPPMAQGKLVHVTHGSVIDVAVDIRKDSETYGQWHAELLSAENNLQFWIPEGFAHGFIALEENTKFAYKCTNYYSPKDERCIIWNDPKLAISWSDTEKIISLKDEQGENFDSFTSPF